MIPPYSQVNWSNFGDEVQLVTGVCPIWGTETYEFDKSGDRYRVGSHRAGGSFEISGSALSALDDSLDGWKKIALTEYIFMQNAGGTVPYIDTQLISGIRPARKLSSKAKLDRFFAALRDCYPSFGEIFSEREFPVRENGQYLAAAINSGFVDAGYARELQLLFDALGERGFVDFATPEKREGRLRITQAGWEYLDSLGASLSLSDQIFVAMWFGTDEQTKLYVEAIKPAIESAGYLPVRIDATEHNEKIDDQIMAEIRKSKAVIVDLTCGLAKPEGDWSRAKVVGAPRGGVFFEAGFARGLAIPVIWTVKKDIADVENVVHFDVRQYNQIRWGSDLMDFKERLRLRIEATLGRGNAQLAD